MHARTFAAPTQHDIRLDLISMNEWRVCDRRFPESDSRSVLGFIERRDFSYEVTSLHASDRVMSFSTLASATLSFAAE